MNGMRRWLDISPDSLGAWRLAFLVLLLVGTASSGWGQTGLTLRGDAVEGQIGGDVKVTFRTEGFWEITEGMGTIQWDPHVMDYVSAGDFGIPELDSGAFSLVPEGMLTFDWSSDNVVGNTLPDGSVLFSLTFHIRGDAGESTTVAFSDAWTPLHFESAESINLPFSSDPGSVSVVPEPSTMALCASALVAAMARRRLRGHHRRTCRP